VPCGIAHHDLRGQTRAKPAARRCFQSHEGTRDLPLARPEHMLARSVVLAGTSMRLPCKNARRDLHRGERSRHSVAMPRHSIEARRLRPNRSAGHSTRKSSNENARAGVFRFQREVYKIVASANVKIASKSASRLAAMARERDKMLQLRRATSPNVQRRKALFERHLRAGAGCRSICG